MIKSNGNKERKNHSKKSWLRKNDPYAFCCGRWSDYRRMKLGREKHRGYLYV